MHWDQLHQFRFHDAFIIHAGLGLECLFISFLFFFLNLSLSGAERADPKRKT